jgi:hypothetical protein
MVLEKKQIKLERSAHTLIETNPPIIKIEVGENEFIEVAEVEKIHQANLELSNSRPFCVLLDTSKGHFNVSPAANKLLASAEYGNTRMAAAIIVKTLATKLAGNFFITFNKPSTPTRLFTNEEDALEWLRKFGK